MKRFNRIKIILTGTAISFLVLACNISKSDSDTGKHSDKNKKNLYESGNNSYADDSLVIAFYNVENLFDTINDPKTDDNDFTPDGANLWTGERYRKELNQLSSVICRIGNRLPAVVGLAEVENKKVVEELIHTGELATGNYAVIHEESPDTRGIDVAMIYRKDIFQYISHTSIHVILPSDTNSKLRDILHMQLKLDNDTFHFFVNHWKSRQPSINETEIKRIETAQILREYIDKLFYINKKSKIIVMGDFNDEPKSKSLYKTLYATENMLNAKYNELYNLLYQKSLKGEGTISRDYAWFMFDNLIVSQSLIDNKGYDVLNKDGFVYKDERILYYNSKAGFKIPNKTYGGKSYYGGYSDHLPVYFILKKSPMPE